MEKKQNILAMRVNKAERDLLYAYYGDSGEMREALIKMARIGINRELRNENPELYEGELAWVPEEAADE